MDHTEVFFVDFIEFRVDNSKRFIALCKVFEALREDKRKETFRNDDEWLLLFDEEALSHFWWPTEEELAAYKKRWKSTPLPQRWSDPSLKHPWGFFSMIDAFKNGEYDLVRCRMISHDRAFLEYYPLADPFGGTECMKALVEVFGFEVIRESLDY